MVFIQIRGTAAAAVYIGLKAKKKNVHHVYYGRCFVKEESRRGNMIFFEFNRLVHLLYKIAV